jgi:hypothetical protein
LTAICGAFVLLFAFGAAGGSLCGQHPAKTGVEHSTQVSSKKPVEVQKGYQPLVAALHVHSSFSNGQHRVFELAAYAHQRKLDVLGITDSFLTRVRYRVGPWKKLISYSASRNSVLDQGIDKYLAAVAAAQRQFDDVILLPGLEVSPFYYWQGSIFDGLRLLGFDRHLLIFGLRNPVQIRNIPVIENETWANTRRDWSEVIGPAATVLCGLILIFWKAERVVRLTYFSVRKQRRFWLPGLLFLLVGALWAYNEYPFGTLSDPYSGKYDVAASQRVVDYACEKGGLTFWSYPEAKVAIIKMKGASMISASHPEDLWLADQYTGFEGIYGGPFTATQPGNVWDRVLLDYLQGGRKSWPSVIAGIDFHYFKSGGGWYELNRGQTVLWAKSKDEASVLDALSRGRGYAVFQPAEDREAILRDFALSSENKVAIAGEMLQTSAPVTVTASVEWSSLPVDTDTALAQMELIRNGEKVDSVESRLPLRVDRSDNLAPGKYYYRLRVKFGLYQELLSNPIFVEVQ